MADEGAVSGVPGVNSGGVITPFSPNPPWNALPLTAATVVAQPADVPQYYKDVFGNVIVRGAVITIVALGISTVTGIATLPVGNRPSRKMTYNSLALDATLWNPPIIAATPVPLAIYVDTSGVISLASGSIIPFLKTYVLNFQFSTT